MKKLGFTLLFTMGLALTLVSCGDKAQTTDDSKLSLDQLLEKYPDSVELLVKRAGLRCDNYNYPKAMEDAAKAFRLDSNNFDARRLYAKVLNNREGRTLDDIMLAKRHYEVLLKKAPKNPELLVAMASIYSQFQDFETSFKFINDALRIDPKYRDAYVLKGSNYNKLGKRDLMRSSYETAIQQDPEFYEGYLFLGAFYQYEENPLAIEYFMSAEQLRPNDPEARYSVAFAMQHLGKLDEAVERYQEMAKDTSKYYSSQAYFQLGHIQQFVRGNLDEAINYYVKATDVQQRFVEAYHNMGVCYDLKGDRTNALKSFGKALKYDPEFTLSREYADSIRP